MPLEGEQLGFLEKTIKLIEKYGLFKIFKALCVIALFVYIMYNGANLDSLISKVSHEVINREHTEKVEAHDRALMVRQSIKPQIDKLLEQVLHKLNADRVFVIEMHNGTNNTSGLPFIYGEMTYEAVANGIEHIDDDYTNLNLSRFSFPLFIEKNHLWQGTMEELEKVDPKIAKRMMSNDATYMAITHIHGVKNELGFFGVTYCNEKPPKSQQEILTIIMEATQKLSTMLDNSNLLDESEGVYE